MTAQYSRKKLRTKLGEKKINGKSYVERLRSQFSLLNNDSWARPEQENISECSDSDLDLSAFLKSSKKVFKSEKGTGHLPVPPGKMLTFQQGVSINREERCEGVVRALRFHPRKTDILLVGGYDKTVRLFKLNSIPTKKGNLLCSVFVDKFRIDDAAWVGPDHQKMIMVGPQEKMYIYDVDSQKGGVVPALHDRSMKKFWGLAVPENASSLFGCNMSDGNVGIFDTRTFRTVRTFKLSGGHCVNSEPIFWQGGEGLVVGDTGGNIYDFDVGKGRCVRKVKNHSINNMCSMVVSNDKLIMGAESGNIDYHPLENGRLPKEINPENGGSVDNLTSAVTCLALSRKKDLLIAGSDRACGQVRGIHEGVMACYRGWPLETSKNMGVVTKVAISHGNERVVVGNDRGFVQNYYLGNIGR